MSYDFETLNTGGGIHPFAASRGVTDPNIITFSVAEMRLELAPGIRKAMHEIVDRGSFGYAPPDKERYNQAVIGWLQKRHGWTVRPEELIQTAGVVTAMGIAIRALTEPGDGILIQTPLYGPFARSILENGRTVIESPLVNHSGYYTMDFDDLREKAKNAKMLMLCSPHNPTGRVWTEEELKELGAICRENNLYVFSDEIHFDLDFTGRHRVITEAVPALKSRTVIGTAPSKTFNLAGNALSNIVIQDEALREKFQQELKLICDMFLGTFAYASTTAAYETGEGWLDALLAHIQKNRAVLVKRLTALIPGAVFSPLEGTYLQWIELRCFGLSQEALMAKLAEAQVFPNSGVDFGEKGEGFIRFNLACPTAAIEAAMDRLEQVL